LLGTRQRLCRVPRQDSTKKSCRDGGDNVNGYFAECPTAGHSAKKSFLKNAECPSARHSAKNFFKKNSLPSALCPSDWHSAKNFFFQNSLWSAL
jgi:hypothetical protein